MYYILQERYRLKARLKYRRNSKNPEFREHNRQKQLNYYNAHKDEVWFKRRNIANSKCYNYRKKRERLLLFSAFSAWRSIKLFTAPEIQHHYLEEPLSELPRKAFPFDDFI